MARATAKSWEDEDCVVPLIVDVSDPKLLRLRVALPANPTKCVFQLPEDAFQDLNDAEIGEDGGSTVEGIYGKQWWDWP
eukprot:13046220-Alexandrium_andersonii.AAC.1